MKSTTLYTLIVLLTISTISVFALYFIANVSNIKYNSFYRTFPHRTLANERKLDVKYNSYYIAGADKESIYLGNIISPLHLLKINTSLTDTQYVKIHVPDVNQHNFRAIKVKVDSPFIYLTDSTVPAILKGKITDWTVNTLKYDSVFFNQIVPISPSSMAISTIRLGKNALEKYESASSHIIYKDNPLKEQISGIFSTDGILLSNTRKNQLVYVYYYRNQFIVMDSSLNLIYEGKTIDTIRIAKIKIDTIRSENSITMASPPLMVNKQSSISENSLFIRSALISKNEDVAAFSKNSVIDVYDLTSGAYKLSFYLANFKEFKIRDFLVYDKSLIVLFDHYLVTYELNGIN